MKSAEVERIVQYFGSRAAGHAAEQGQVGGEDSSPSRAILLTQALLPSIQRPSPVHIALYTKNS